MLISLNKAIFYCEILKCKKLLLRKNNSAYIRNIINDKKYGLIIEEINSSIIINNENLLSNYYNPYYDFLGIKPNNRLYVFKNEILRNLPFIQTKENDLYIHIRSGDIFLKSNKGNFYSQPPLCFYKTIINNNKFNKIIIISENKLNPIVDKLIKKYPYIIYKPGNIKLDIAKLIYAFNIVSSISSFLMGIIKLNDNLRNIWEYDIYKIRLKIYHLHHSLYKYRRKYTIFLMNPSKQYMEKMYLWQANRKQINIMLRDKCPKIFRIIKPNYER